MEKGQRFDLKNLNSKTYRISLLVDLGVTADMAADAKEILFHIRDQFKIKKKYDNFVIDSLDMEYDVYKMRDESSIIDV